MPGQFEVSFGAIFCGLFAAGVTLHGETLRAAESTPAPTYSDVAYGPDERNLLDFWQASGDGPRPVLVYIHGGGWLHGEKTDEVPNLLPFLDNGISCASITYRMTDKHPLPAPVRDAALAIQFIRSKAAEWNVDKSRIALTGGSAGACTSMWILLHDDLADPKSDDPVLRESTRVTAAAVVNGQTSIDPLVIKEWMGESGLGHPMICMAVGERSIADAVKNYESHRQMFAEFSPYNHLDKDDPPLLMIYSGAALTLPTKDGIHHPLFGVKLKEKSDRVGHECYLFLDNVAKPGTTDYATDFLIGKLLAK